MIRYVLVIIIILLYFNNHQIEGLINEYQFHQCSDKKGEPLTYYRKVLNEIEPNRVGFYSDLLNVIDDKDSGEKSQQFRTPLCEKEYDYEKDYFNDNLLIDTRYNTFQPEFNPLNDNKDLSNYNYNEIHYKNENLQLLVKEKNRLDKYIAKRKYES